MSACTTVTVRISKTKTKRLTAGKISGRFNLSVAVAEAEVLKTVLKPELVEEENFLLDVAMLFAAIFPPAQRACNFDTSADRNVCNSRLCDRSRLSAIIWKQLYLQSSATCEPRSSEIICKPASKHG